MHSSVRVQPRLERGFTLIELLVVISIISLLISILLPSMGRARAQAKGVHCLARLKDIGNALAAYENIYATMPPALWYPDELDEEVEGVEYGWMEILFTHLYEDDVRLPVDYPVQRHIEGNRWGEYFLCKAVGDEDVSSGHYRVYLPSWSYGTYTLDEEQRWTEDTHPNPLRAATRERIRPRLPLIGDANELSERGDGLGTDDCSYIDGGEANYVGSDGFSNGNRFSDRHYGGANYLFQDLHATWNNQLRKKLARDYDLNGVEDIEILP